MFRFRQQCLVEGPRGLNDLNSTFMIRPNKKNMCVLGNPTLPDFPGETIFFPVLLGHNIYAKYSNKQFDQGLHCLPFYQYF